MDVCNQTGVLLSKNSARSQRSLKACSATLAAVFFLLGYCDAAFAQFHDGFDSARPAFELFKTDCDGPEKTWVQMRANEANAQNRFEQIHFETGSGTTILAAADLPPAFVIDELKISARIKANRPGIRMMARVVLPGTRSPDGDGPLKITIPGPVCRDVDRWVTLDLTVDSSGEPENVTAKLRERVWTLRQNHNMTVDTNNAYIDKVVFDLYTSPGELTVCLDDLRVNGIAHADRMARAVRLDSPTDVASMQAQIRESRNLANESLSIPPESLSLTNQNTPDENGADPSDPIVDRMIRPASFDEPVAGSRKPQQPVAGSQQKQPSLVSRVGTVLTVRNAPFFPRIVQYNDEPFVFLKSLGFNTIELSATATLSQLQQAEDLDLWIVCPAPPSAGLEPIGFTYDRVLAWSPGHRLTGKELQNVQQRIREIRQSDMRSGRPIVGGVDAEWRMYSRELDILATGIEPLGTSFIASTYSDWLRAKVESTSNSRPLWAMVQTELSNEISRQISAVTQPVPPLPVEPQQMKFLAYEAIAGGARGLRFTSRNRLDLPDPVTRLRVLTIQWTLRHIDQIEPWAVGGAVTGTLPLNNNHLEVTAINTNRSRLLLIQRPTHHEQYWAGDTPLESVNFRDNASTFSGQAYMLSDESLVPLPGLRNYGGAEVTIESCPFCTAVVLTDDPLVINRLRQSYQQQAGSETLLQMRAELTRQWLAIMQLVDGQMGRMGRGQVAASSALNEAVNAWRKASELISSNSPATCVSFLNRADERLALARRELLTGPLGRFKSKTSTPFLSHVSLVPLHWQLSDRLGESSWNPNGLAGGDFENLNHMTENGWQNHRLASDELNTKVELSETATIDGNYGLKLTVTPTDSFQGVVQSTPVWITSGKVAVRTGQLIRIHGWVNVPETIRGSHHGLMITESIGGRQLAERIPMTHGWQELTLYRTAPSDGDMDVTLSLTGVGTAMVDELTIRTIDLGPAGPSAREARN